MSTEDKPSRSLGQRITTLVLLLALLLASIWIFVYTLSLHGISLHGMRVKAVVERNPPVAITFRSGILSDYVIQVYNLSAQRLMMAVHIEKQDGKHAKSPRFSLEPNGEKELGRLELDDLCPIAGDSGWIEVEGWTRVLQFSLSSEGTGQYSYAFGLPTDD